MPETPARPHGTAGAEVRLFAFHPGGHERRVSISPAADFADRDKDGNLSDGFWT